ncbi:hypothetical protein BB561_003721 [Smittium simulii]|uniref:Carbohydrate-binding module family 19 domain-containing protein n=1 Tax=Smittium simulii TaxID=133385 RepID=A0A2T9YJV3_9FUNG|nr:hypothetical protein BB561_003721 [Smittium simulii]
MFSIKYLLSFFVLIHALFYCAAVSNGSGLDLNIRAPESPPTGHGYGYGRRCRNGEKRCNSNQTGYTECVRGKDKFVKCRRGQFCVMLNGPNAMCVKGKNDKYPEH